jgi:hypothetical protein
MQPINKNSLKLNSPGPLKGLSSTESKRKVSPKPSDLAGSLAATVLTDTGSGPSPLLAGRIAEIAVADPNRESKIFRAVLETALIEEFGATVSS